ncbi:alpha-glucosidase [Pediococcus argentinicus]|nr:alpha-glucosidase [Pediococcus argentinicus]NKZ21774.1 alpha-glucosidase [Pediococcus argentinicus]GEP18967.1 alpha-glucosidase [Pediococcus argentinicus]
MEEWFDKAIIYQVYPKSFKDSNGDGIGDIRGIIEKVAYIKSLGVNTIWVNPMYVSPQVDNGYDVSNYFAIDESMGTMEDFEELVKVVHDHGMKIIMDFVLNHTSDQHPWFQDAKNNPHSLYRNYYLWSKGKNGSEPNNWGSFFGGSVWSRVHKNDSEYYFHLFNKHMPDLNWKNPEVQQSVTDIAKFWVAKGIDGFRLDAFIHISKADFNQDYISHEKHPLAEPYYANRSEVQSYLRYFTSELRKEKPDIYILGEASSADINLALDYSNPQSNLCDQVITFRLFADKLKNPIVNLPSEFQPVTLDVQLFKKQMAEWQANMEGICYPTLYWSNHDTARLISRYGDSDYPINSAKALATVLYLQRGVPIIYFGEELGMQNAYLDRFEQFEDQNVDDFANIALKNGISKNKILNMLNSTHKMSARNVMHWSKKDNFGFSNHDPWIGGKSTDVNVDEEDSQSDSVLNYYRELLKIKQSNLYSIGKETIDNCEDPIFSFSRSYNNYEAKVIVNLSCDSQQYQLDNEMKNGKRILSEGQLQIKNGNIQLGPWSSIIIESKEK